MIEYLTYSVFKSRYMCPRCHTHKPATQNPGNAPEDYHVIGYSVTCPLFKRQQEVKETSTGILMAEEVSFWRRAIQTHIQYQNVAKDPSTTALNCRQHPDEARSAAL